MTSPRALLLAMMTFVSLAGPCQAQMPATPLGLDIQRDRQQSLLDDAQRQRESLQRGLEIVPQAEPAEPDHAAPCFVIDHFEWQDAPHLSDARRQALTHPLEGQCLSLTQMQALAHRASNAYIEKGYVTSLVHLPDQDVSDGTLRLQAQEGRIEAITLTLDGQQPRGLEMIFPHARGSVLNLRTLEQGMEQIDRLPSQRVSIDIQPGTRQGYSRVVLHRIHQDKPWRIALGIDNSGQKGTGTRQGTLGLALDSPLGLFDQWQFETSHDLEGRQGHLSRGLAAGVTLPYGDWSFGYRYARSDSEQPLRVADRHWPYLGSVSQHVLDLHRNLYRDGDSTLGWALSLTRRDARTTFAGQRLNVSSPTLAIAGSGLEYATRLGSGYFTLNPSVSRGLHALGASADQRGLPPSDFTRISLAASGFLPLTPTISYLTSGYLQTTPDDLYPSERISIGGEYSVRGFKDTFLDANRGAYWRNQIDWSTQALPLIGQPTLSVALDAGGTMKSRSAKGGGLLGSAISLALSQPNLTQSFSLGKPLLSPRGLHPARWVVYWQASFTL